MTSIYFNIDGGAVTSSDIWRSWFAWSSVSRSSVDDIESSESLWSTSESDDEDADDDAEDDADAQVKNNAVTHFLVF